MELQAFRAETWPCPARRVRRWGAKDYSSSPGHRDYDFCAGQQLRQHSPISANLAHLLVPPLIPTPPHPRGLTRSRHARALGRLSRRLGRGGENSVTRGCWFLPSLAPPCALDNGAQSSVTILRGSPLSWGNQEGVFREVFRPTPFPSSPVRSGGQAWK